MLSLVTISFAGDWPQCGPDRTGKSPNSPKLADHWGKAGRNWSGRASRSPAAWGGLGSPVVADGKVVLYFNPVENVPLTTRKVNEQALRQLGWLPKGKENRPQPYWDDMEKARLSDERAALTSPNDIFEFADKWAKENLKEKTKLYDRYHGYMEDRIRRSKDAFAFADLNRLAQVRTRSSPPRRHSSTG